MLVAFVVFAGCSSDAGGGTGEAVSPSVPIRSASTEPTPSASVVTGPDGPPLPLPRSAHPPLAGFGEVHDIGTVVDIIGDSALHFDRKAYVHCIPEADDADPCLDGYRIDDVEPETREYALASTVRVTLSVQPEEYETGDLVDLREFVAANPSNLVILQFDAEGQVIAVGQPWLP